MRILDNNGVVDLADVDVWLSNAGLVNHGAPMSVGDANLDGSVDSDDFDIWVSNRFATGGGWCGADFNADGATALDDLHILHENFDNGGAQSVLLAGIRDEGAFQGSDPVVTASPLESFDIPVAKRFDRVSMDAHGWRNAGLWGGRPRSLVHVRVIDSAFEELKEERQDSIRLWD